MSRSTLRRAGLWLGLAALTLLALELLSFVAYRVLQGHSFSYSAVADEQERRMRREVDPDDDTRAVPPHEFLREDVLHPFLGFSGSPESDPGFTDLGFWGRLGRPLPRRGEGVVLVGVFGGSVAGGFSGLGAKRLEQRLRGAGALGDRELVILNTAYGGYKQPQQLMALAWVLALGGELDVLLNIDGFNEVALDGADNAPGNVFEAYPRGWGLRMAGRDDPERLARIGAVVHLRGRRERLAAAFSGLPWRASVTAGLLWTLLDQWSAVSLGEARERLAALPATTGRYEALGPPRLHEGRALDEELAALWERCSIQIHGLCRANGIRYLHFLQPNQYDEGSKPLTPEEKRRAFDPDHPYREGARRGYPLLRARGQALRRAGIAFHDLSRIFVDVHEPLYIDDCCHLSQRGYEILADAVAEALLQSGALDPPHRD